MKIIPNTKILLTGIVLMLFYGLHADPIKCEFIEFKHHLKFIFHNNGQLITNLNVTYGHKPVAFNPLENTYTINNIKTRHDTLRAYMGDSLIIAKRISRSYHSSRYDNSACNGDLDGSCSESQHYNRYVNKEDSIYLGNFKQKEVYVYTQKRSWSKKKFLCKLKPNLNSDFYLPPLGRADDYSTIISVYTKNKQYITSNEIHTPYNGAYNLCVIPQKAVFTTTPVKIDILSVVKNPQPNDSYTISMFLKTESVSKVYNNCALYEYMWRDTFKVKAGEKFTVTLPDSLFKDADMRFDINAVCNNKAFATAKAEVNRDPNRLLFKYKDKTLEAKNADNGEAAAQVDSYDFFDNLVSSQTASLPFAIETKPSDYYYNIKCGTFNHKQIISDNDCSNASFEQDGQYTAIKMNAQSNFWYTVVYKYNFISSGYSAHSTKEIRLKGKADDYNIYIYYIHGNTMFFRRFNVENCWKSCHMNQPGGFYVKDLALMYNPKTEISKLKAGMYPQYFYSPEFYGATHTLNIASNTSGIIPLVIYNDGRIEKECAQLIWINDSLKYFYKAHNLSEYFLPLNPGTYKLRLRALKRDITINNFEVKENAKTYLYVNADQMIKQSPTENFVCTDELSETDMKDLLSKTAAVQNYTSCNFIYNNKQISNLAYYHYIFLPQANCDSITIAEKPSPTTITREIKLKICPDSTYSAPNFKRDAIPLNYIGLNKANEMGLHKGQDIDILNHMFINENNIKTQLEFVMPNGPKLLFAGCKYKNDPKSNIYNPKGLPSKAAIYTAYMVFENRKVLIKDVEVKENHINYVMVDSTEISDDFDSFMHQLKQNMQKVIVETNSHVKLILHDRTRNQFMSDFGDRFEFWINEGYDGYFSTDFGISEPQFIKYERSKDFYTIDINWGL